MELTNRILENKTFIKRLKEVEEAEKERVFCRHGMDHLMDVARIAHILNLERGCSLSKDLIYAAALLHDIGRAEEYVNGTPHDEAGVGIAEVVLAECGAAKNEKEAIIKTIQGHRGQGTDADKGKDGSGWDIASLIKEADKLSRPCFDCKARAECKWPEEKRNKGILL